MLPMSAMKSNPVNPADSPPVLGLRSSGSSASSRDGSGFAASALLAVFAAACYAYVGSRNLA